MVIRQYSLVIIVSGLTFPLYGQVNRIDTIFISKDPLLGTAQSIYFDNNKNSKFYKHINYWKFLEFDQESYKESLTFLKKKRLKLIKVTPVVPWRKWVTLKQYKGKFYAYYPSDFYNHFKQSVNDTTFIDWTGEGPIANKITSQKKIDLKTYEFKLIGFYAKYRKLTIHIIDSKKRIAVFEDVDNKKEKHYYLMIESSKINTVPLIVNRSETEKQPELEFDQPDFIKLLKNK
ncbi:hypothetical protein EON73_04670 [bacterium]|nr:MAG: hypothetical protein EON73_04670 [bacterium]